MPAAWVEAWRYRPSSFNARCRKRAPRPLRNRAPPAAAARLRSQLREYWRSRVLRHHLAQLVDLPVRHFQHAADVAQHAARLQRAKGDDLRDLVAAVFLLHIANNFVAAVLTEVDIEVRHRHALGIEEALEQQARNGSDQDR